MGRVLHHRTAAALLLWCVRIVSLVNLGSSQQGKWRLGTSMAEFRTVPHLLGTMKSLGSLSVNAIKLR